MLKRLFSQTPQASYPVPYPPQNAYFDINRYQNEINELKRMNNELLKRINRLENYLGIRAEADQSNYQ